MYYRLKSFKTLQICSNGSVYLDSAVYFKTFKRYTFLKKSLGFNLLTNKQKISSTYSKFFYKKYCNQIF